MKNLLLLLVLACCSLQSVAQTNLDSLRNVWNDNTQPDSSRLRAIHNLAWYGHLFSRPDSAFYYAQLEFDFAQKTGSKKWMAGALNTQGVSFDIRGNYPTALEYHKRSLGIKEQIADIKGMSASLANIGAIYYGQDEYELAIEYFNRSLIASEEIEDKEGVANALLNIGTCYLEINDYPKALDYYLKSLEIYEESNIKSGIAGSLDGLGSVYLELEQYSNATDYFERSISIYEEFDDIYGLAFSLRKIGVLNHALGNHRKSIQQCSQSLAFAREIGDILQQRDAYECLYDTYKSMGNGNKALEYHELMLALDDSLNAEETTRQLQKMEFQKQVLADSISNAEEARLVEEAHKEEVRKKNKTRNALIGGGLFLFLIAAGIYSRLRYTRKAKAEIEKEKDRSENLLLNILPADIAAELKEKGRADARDFEMVSILFTDFKGFTAASEKLSAQDLVSEINTCFEAFDGIMGKYGIEKIKTIGDAYMAAGGLPVPTDDSVKNTVLAALEMQDFIRTRKTKLDAEGKPGFEMRVGVHTGPVVAGIVGVKKFQYDIWGDTVNTASRMESSGEVGKVNISEATYDLLKEDTQFSFESRGKVEAKGKGEMEMYFVSQKG